VKIDLSKIEGEPKTFAESFDLGDDKLDPNRVTGRMQIHLKGSVRPLGEHYFVDGRLTADGRISCGRCLEPVDWRTDSEFNMEIALVETAPLDPEIALDEADLDLVYLEKPILELEELAIEQIELELPIRVLCTEDCAGLCPRCGANRNVPDACTCEPETDPRWAALGDLVDRDPEDATE
jgi:uncharacterized protein